MHHARDMSKERGIVSLMPLIPWKKKDLRKKNVSISAEAERTLEKIININGNGGSISNAALETFPRKEFSA
jgi:hypothetical protein